MPNEDSPQTSVPVEPATKPAPAATNPPAVETKPAEGEKPAEGQAAEEQKPDKLGVRFAALSREERRLTKERGAFKAEKEAHAAELEKARARETVLQEAKKDPKKLLGLLDEAGITFDDLTKALLDSDGGKPDPKVEELEARVNKLQEEKETEKQAEEKRRQQQTQEFINREIESYKELTTETIKADPERWELILANDAVEDVYSVVEKYFEETGEILDPDVAADFLEKQLTEQAKTLLSLKKLAPEESSPGKKKSEPVKVTANGVRDTQPPKTLDNSALPAGGDINRAVNRDQKIKQAAELLVFN